MKIHIYAIYFPSNNKYYIGQTKDIKKRMGQHFKSGSLVCKALWKYDDWQVTILHTTRDRNTANLLEIENIRNYNSVAPNGYNLTHGGDGNDAPCSKETKEKISKSQTGNQNSKGHKQTIEHREKISRANKGNQNFKGHKHSEETKEKNRLAQIGNQRAKGKHWKLSAETKEKMSRAKKGKGLGNQNSKGKNLKHGRYTKEAKIDALKIRIVKLAKVIEIEE